MYIDKWLYIRSTITYDTNTLEGKMLHQVKQTTAERGDVLNNSRTT